MKKHIEYTAIPVVFVPDVQPTTPRASAKVVLPETLIAEVGRALSQVKLPFKIGSFPTAQGIMTLHLSNQPKFYGLTGDTYLLRDVLPKNVGKGGRLQSPLFNKKWGYMYFKNGDNKKSLVRLLSAVKAVNRRYKGYTIATEGPQNKKWGILGWDVPYTDPAWVTQITGTKWRPRSNPERLPDGTWIFRKCSFTHTAANRALTKLHTSFKSGKKVWKGLYPKILEYKKGRLTNAAAWHEFVEHPSFRAALAGWAGHARFLYKDINIRSLTFYDPWKQHLGRSPALRTVQEEFKDWNVMFEKRKGEQGAGEGSCAVIAFIRVILMAEYGLRGATMTIPPPYAVLGSRILSITR